MICECNLEDMKALAKPGAPLPPPSKTQKPKKTRTLSALWQEALLMEGDKTMRKGSPGSIAKELGLKIEGYRHMVQVFEKQGFSVSGNGPVVKGESKFIIRAVEPEAKEKVSGLE